MCSASNPEQPPKKANNLLSLPEEIVLSCLARVPRNCNLNVSHVSKTLRTFVNSPELNRLRSLLHKSSLYVCFHGTNENGRWTTSRLLTLEKITTSTIEYRLVMFPSHPYTFMRGSLAVSVGSKIYFLSKHCQNPSNFWVLDTLSGKFSQRPSMKVDLRSQSVGVINGKIYVMGFVGLDSQKIQVEVFDPKLKIWKSAGHEKVPQTRYHKWYHKVTTASLERKVYRVKAGVTSVYNPREGEGERMVHMVNKRLSECNRSEGIRKEKLIEEVDCVCVVENVLYAYFWISGLMWFDTKLNIWRRVVSRKSHDTEEVGGFGENAVAENEGKLTVFKFINHDGVDNTKSVKMFLFSLHRVRGGIVRTMEWSGIVATVPSLSQFGHCFGIFI